MAIVRRLEQKRFAFRNSAFIKGINDIIYSPWGIVILGLMTVSAFAFSLEIAFYTFVVVYAVYVSIFADDFTPIIPLFILCYVTPSLGNNPGESEDGLFYGASGIYLICIASVAILALLIRLIVDKELGGLRIFTAKRTLLPGILILGASYMLSGLGHEQYEEYAKRNLLFAFIQFMSVFLLYFILTTAIKWDKFNPEYFAWAGLVMGIVVSLEVGIIYIYRDVIVDGVIMRGRITSGWGIYNNIGAIISMSIPFAFYLASRKKRSSLFLILGCLLLAGVIFSCSRGSIVGGVFAFAVSFIYTFFNCKSKTEYRLTTLALLVAAGIGAFVFREKIVDLFNAVPDIAEGGEGGINFNDSGRFNIYKNGFEIFLRNPIFGQTFYPIEFDLYDHSTVESFSSFFPPRWHNTIIQMLASCGAVGMLAYLYHRLETVLLYFKKRTHTNTYIAFMILTLIGMSMLDCHFFNVAPVLFYSMALAVMEFAEKPSEI